MSLYFDASVLVALFVIDPASARATDFLSTHPAIVGISDFGTAEFSLAVARRVRTADLTREDGHLAFLWCVSLKLRRVHFRQEGTSVLIALSARRGPANSDTTRLTLR